MNTLQSKEAKIIGALFLISGIAGVFTFIAILFPFNSLLSLINTVPLLLFAFTGYSGYLLLVQENEKGLDYLRAIVAVQIIQFHLFGIGYYFVTGGFATIGIINISLNFNFGFDNNFIINLTEENNDFILRLNILALFAFGYLTRMIQKVEREEELL
ncbi:MAG: hypothetical protein ACI85I_001785 [Arenicella sp.]|jgi:hypothetical protein